MPKIVENPSQHRFEMKVGPGAVALAYYREEDGHVLLTHTEVPSDYAGQGSGTALATGVFDLLRQSGRRAVLKCPFMGAFFAHHPEYADIVTG